MSSVLIENFDRELWCRKTNCPCQLKTLSQWYRLSQEFNDLRSVGFETKGEYHIDNTFESINVPIFHKSIRDNSQDPIIIDTRSIRTNSKFKNSTASNMATSSQLRVKGRRSLPHTADNKVGSHSIFTYFSSSF